MDTPVTPRKKLGLALSGGGFRASLFHIGVLARLAELDQLKDIEVISPVSGGSILGAYYYLKVKQLLDGRHDASQVADRNCHWPPGRLTVRERRYTLS